MEFEWDEAKRLINLEKNRIDFVDVGEVWRGRDSITTSSNPDVANAV